MKKVEATGDTEMDPVKKDEDDSDGSQEGHEQEAEDIDVRDIRYKLEILAPNIARLSFKNHTLCDI